MLCEVVIPPLLEVLKQRLITCMGRDDRTDVSIRSRMGPGGPSMPFQLRKGFLERLQDRDMD